MELHCSYDLALRLGAIVPDNARHHRQLRDTGICLLMRDPRAGVAMFWPWQMTGADIAAERAGPQS